MVKKYSLIFIAFLCFSLFGVGQTTILSESFTDGSLPSGWSQTDIAFETAAGGYAKFEQTTSILTSPIINLSPYTAVELTFDVAKWGSGTDGPLKVEISDDGGTTWSAQTYNSPTPINGTYKTSGPTIITASGSNVRIRLIRTESYSAKRFRNFLLEGTAPSGPTLTATDVLDLDYEIGNGPSTAGSFEVTGANLTGSITVAAPTNFSIATSSGGTYGSSATIPAGSANGTSTLYTILNSGLAINTYSGNATISSTGATSITAAFSGEVTDVYTGTCASESFDNSNASDSYGSNSYTGDNGVTWSYTDSRNDGGYNITGDGLMLRRIGSNLTSSSVPGGIGDFTCKLLKAFTGSGNRQVELFVNGVSQGTSIAWDNTTIQTFTVTGINISGNVIVEIRNITSKQVIIDDIEWTCYTACPAPADPTGSIAGTTPACASTTLTYTGTAAADTVNYWQTSATGTATSDNATGTYNATTTGTYYIRAYDTTEFCWSTGTLSYAVVIEDAAPTLTQPTNQNEVIPNTATFSVSSSDTDSYQWQVNTGSGWNNVTGGSGATTDTYTTAATTNTMDGNQYRCILTNICGTTTSNAVTLNLSNDSPNNATGLEACLGETSINLDWNASSGALTPTGYIVFAQPGSTVSTSTAAAAGDASAYTANTNYTLATTYGTLGKAVYKGTNTNATITGLTSGNDYTFKVVAYYSEDLTGWSSAINNTGSWNDTYTIGMPEATFTNASIAPTSSVLSWTNPLPTSCYELLIVANQGGITSFTPTNGNTYAANATYGGANSIVFAGTGITTTVNGLTDGLEYCYTIFVRNIATGEWSSGTSICQTTGLSYCDSSGGSSTPSGILNVSLNTINETSSSNPAYTDFTAAATDLTIGETYPLSVNVNTGGYNTSYVKVWIDWDRDGSFNSSSNEAIELGTLYNNSNGQPSLSPINITVPSDAYIGNVRMRVSSNSDSSDSDYATSCQEFDYGEVEDYIINIVRPVGAEIHVEGNNNTILNGDISTSGLNNTAFGTTNIGNTIVKTFTIESLGAATLNLTGSPDVQITGTNAADFVVTSQPTDSNLSPGEQTDFTITFTPSGSGIRTANVEISTNDSDENPFTFAIKGTGECNPATYEMSPSTGPAGTVVTITTTSGSNADSGTALYDGMATTVNNISATIFEITIPNNAISSNISFDDTTGCTRYLPFTVITSDITSCEGSGTLPSDIFISEVTDRDSSVDGHSYIELFNGTGNPVDISDYEIKIRRNGGSTTGTINIPNSTILLDNETYVISFGTGSTEVDPVSQNDYFSNTIGINDEDHLILNNGSSNIDLWGDTSGDPFTGGVGTEYNGSTPNGSDYTYRRNYEGTTLPNMMTWDPTDWTLITPVNYSDIGNYDFSTGTPPVVNNLEAQATGCNETTLTVYANEGFTGGNSLRYIWYYYNPAEAGLGWQQISNGGIYTTVNTSQDLVISDTASVLDYQFYCEVREDDATCYDASIAVKLILRTATWSGGNWDWNDGTPQNELPTLSTVAIINDDYDTSFGNAQSFSACNLILNDAILTINDGNYVEVENNLTVNGTTGAIEIEPQGSFVQINDSGDVVAATPTNLKVSKLTAPSYYWYEYTYWSSPVFEETPALGLAPSNPNRRYQYNAKYYRDSTYETDNDGSLTIGPGIDDIDDNGDDWGNISTTYLTPGVGYASTHNPSTFSSTLPCPGPTCRIRYTFSGLFNNGIIEVPLYRNDSEPDDNNWNLVGNPYPSAISADVFLATNMGMLDESIPETDRAIDGAIYLWSQNTAPSASANGNQGLNFSDSDYAIINGTGETAAGGDSTTPSRYIPSGQGFFISMNDGATATTESPTPVSDEIIRTADLIFNNAMRVTGNNNQFFRSNESNNKLWVNLTSDNGVFAQVLIGYLDHATDGYDGMYFDAPRNGVNSSSSTLYSLIPNETKKLAIQGKNSNSLNIEEMIPLGFYTSIDVATLYSLSIAQFEGDFMTENAVYIKDNLLNTTHNLKESDYTFTSETGEFNERFEIVFTSTTLSLDDNITDANEVTITELPNGDVQIKVGNNHTIKHVDIIDITGRLIYSLQGNNSTEVYNLSKLSMAAYIAKITLFNGQMISKKAIKQR